MSLQPLLYRINDFVQVTGLGRSTTYRLIKEGKLRIVKIAGRTLIPAEEVTRLIAAGAT
jgi:excisionase family DNA binding protein